MRAAIFIDGGYLIKQLQDEDGAVDYEKFADYLLAPMRQMVPLDLLRCYFYYCPPWMSDKPTEAEMRRMAAHEKFVAEMQGISRFKVRLGKLEKRREDGREVFAQKRVDVQLSVDLVQHCAAGHIQHAILVAGDSDFIPAVVSAQESGTTVTLWCDKDKSVHRDLVAHADEVFYFDWKKFPLRKAAPVRRAPNTRAKVAALPVGESATLEVVPTIVSSLPPATAKPAPAPQRSAPSVVKAMASAVKAALSPAPNRNAQAAAPAKVAAPSPAEPQGSVRNDPENGDGGAEGTEAAPAKRRRRGRRGGRGRRKAPGPADPQ